MRIFFTIGLAALFLGFASDVSAALKTWIGTGGTGNWSTSANWSPGIVPQPGDDISFPAGATGLVNTNNIANRNYSSIAFSGGSGGYILRGNPLGLTNGLTAAHTTGLNTVELTITNGASLTVTATTGGTLALNGAIVLGGFNLTNNNTTNVNISGLISGSGNLVKTGTGKLLLNGSAANTYSGVTTVSAGTLDLNDTVVSSISVMVPGDLVISNAATVLVSDTDGNQIADTANVSIFGSGVLNLVGASETIGALTMTGGSVTAGVFTLTLGGNLTTIGSATTATISGNLSLGGATRTFSVGSGAANPDLLISANISGSPGVGFTKTGSGQMTLSGVNTYTGVTTNNLGFIILNTDSALGANGSVTNGTVVNANSYLLVSGVDVGNEFLTLAAGADFRSSGTASWAGPVTLNGDVFINCFGGTFTNSGAITGTGGVTKGSSGTLIYTGSGANTYSGDTIVNQGVLQLAKSVVAAGIVNGTITIGDDVGGSDADVIREMSANQINSAVPITINSSGLLDLNNFSDAIGAITFSGGHLSSGTGIATLTGNITANANTNNPARMDGIVSMSATRTFNVAQGIWSPDLQLDATTIGAGGITKTGAGEMSLTTSNSYSGLTTVGAGFLTIDDSFGLGATNTGTVVSSNAVLALRFGSHVGLEALTLNGPGSPTIFGALSSSFGSNSWAGAISLGSDSTVSVIAATNFLNLSGPISGTGNFTKIGPGTLIFSGSVANTYSGSTFMNEGTMLLGKTGGSDSTIPHDLTVGDGTGTDVVRHLAQNQISNTSHVTVNLGGLLDLNNVLDGIGDLEMTGGAVDSGTSFLLLLSGGVTTHGTNTTATIDGTLNLNNAVRTFDIGPGTITPDLQINAVIPNGGIIKTSNGSLGLTGTNTYTGLTTISNGLVFVDNAAALGATNAGTVLESGGYLRIDGVSVVGEALTNHSASGQVKAAGVSGWSGNIVLNSNLDFLVYAAASFTLSGVISGSGAVTKSDFGTLLYSGGSANTYTNTTTVTQGTLQLSKTVTDGAIQGDLVIGDGAGGALADVVRLVGNPQLATACDVTIASSGLLDLNEISEGIGLLSGAGEVDTGSTGTGALFLNGSSSTTYSGVIIGAGSLQKQGGVGTFTLTGTNTYTGTTTVTAGTLLVNGSQPQSPVTVGASGTLGGSGTVGNIAASGNLAPGNSPGILTSSNVVFAASGDYFVELTGPVVGTQYDQLNVRGTNTLANAVLHLTNAFTTPVALGQPFTILNNDLVEAINGTFSGLAEGATITSGGYKFTISYVGNGGNDVVLTLTALPGVVLGSTVTAGNGSHAIDPNDCNNLALVITNTSGSPLTNVSATLSTTTPGVLITQPYSPYPIFTTNGKGTNTAPFQISTLPGFPCGTNINLQLSVDTSLGSFTMNFTVPSGESAAPTRFDNNNVTNCPDIGTIESTNTVAAWPGGPITKVAVSLWLVAPIDSDMSLSLISPNGTTVSLVSGVGVGANFGSGTLDASRTIFDDAAGTAITAGAAPFVGTFRPQGALTNFIGTTANGAWRLRVQDSFGSGSPDTLRAWSLFLSGTACATGSGACDYCLTSITGTITNTDLIQTNRFLRNAIVASCGAPKVFPGFNDLLPGSPRHCDIYSFTNTSASDACVTVLLNGAGDLQAGVYLNAFDPANIATNYVADSGGSTLTSNIGSAVGPQSCSATIPAGAKFIVTVNEIVLGGGSTNYTLQLSGLPCPPPVLNIQTVQTNKARLFWPTSAGGYQLESESNLLANAFVTVTNEPIVNGGNYNVTNSSVSPTNRFYRLKKP